MNIAGQVNRLNVVEQLLEWKVDGIISDCESISCFVVPHLTIHSRPKRSSSRHKTKGSACSPQIPQAEGVVMPN